MIHTRIKKIFPQFSLDVDFTIQSGIVGILGTSGSGKSVTLQCIAGLEQPDEGFIQVNDRILVDSYQKINVKARYRKMGFMFQNYALFPHLTAKQNIAFGLKGLPKKEIEEKISSIMKKLN